MLQSIVKWVWILACMLALGPIAGKLTGGLRASDGGRDVSLLLCATPAKGLIAGAAGFGLALAGGAIGAWLAGRRTGFMCAGLVLVWSAWNLGRVDAILGRTLTGATLYTLALEGIMLAVAGVGLGFAIMMTPRLGWGVRPGHHEEPSSIDLTAPGAMLASMLVSAVAVWIIAADTLKGQTIAATVIAGVFAAASGRVVSQRVTPVVFIGAMGVLCACGPALATVVHGARTVDAAMAQRLLAIARPMPMDWIAGAFLGVPMGLAWAGSMTEKHAHKAAPATAA